jgi:hypothetical protein
MQESSGTEASSTADSQGLSSEYEFEEAHNRTFSRLARAMRFVGGGQTVVAVVYAATALLGVASGDLVGAAGGLTTSVVILLIGIWTLNAARHVREIIATEGNDISHLMRAMRALVKLYSLQRTILIIAMVFAGLALLVNGSVLVRSLL